MAQKYTGLFAAIHWIHAAMIAAVLLGALLTLPVLPEIGGDLSPFKNHILMGVAVTVVTFIRLYLVRRQPELEPLKVSPARQALITWNHRLIYFFLILVGLSGMATAQLSNIGKVLFLGADGSAYTGPGGLTETLGTIHMYGAWILGILIVMHVAGTISYIIKTGDNVLKRVGFGQG